MGGGAMRTAAKAAVFAGYRSTAARRLHNLPSAAAAASSTVQLATEGESAPLISISSEKMPCVDPKPRLVFGPVPSAEEAEEATKDLKEAIDNIYFSSAAEDYVEVGQVSDLGGSMVILPSMPKPVVQAFTMLQGSPEAQSVVASLASDPNIWEAFLKNDKVIEFYIKHQSSENSIALPKDLESEAAGENESSKESSETMEDSPNGENSETGSAFLTDFVQNIKVKVSEMVSNISGFLQDLIGASFESHGAVSPKTTAYSTADSYADVAFGASFMALAVAAILVILLKRG